MPEQRTIIVTGANKGIGLAVAIDLAREGFDVVGTVRDAAKADDLRRAAERAGVRCRTAILDVTDEVACRDLVQRESPWGLVNNAGYAATGSMLDVSDDEAREQLETLVLAPARLGCLAATGMLERGEPGRIVNISSIASELSGPLLGWYQAAKSALEAISDAMRLELQGDGIDVVLVQPGVIQTEIWERSREDADRPTRYGAATERWQQLTRLAEPYMSSPDAVARTVRGAFQAARPRDRYPVGVDAQVLTRVARFVPVPVTDAVTRLLLNLR